MNVSVEIPPLAAEQIRRDARFGAEQLSEAARTAVAAWVMAVDGDEAQLNALAGTLNVETLLRAPWRQWRIGPGPRVTSILMWALEAGEEPVLRLKVMADGHQWFPAQPGKDTSFIALLDLTTDRTARTTVADVLRSGMDPR